MELLPVLLAVMTTIFCQTGALQCPSCNYFELPSQLANFGDGESDSDVTCKDGGDSINSTTCESPSSGEKSVCINAKAKINMEFAIAGATADLSFTIYSRDCGNVSETEHPEDTGSLDLDDFSSDIESLFEDLNSDMDVPGMSITFTGASGGAEFCSTDDCGKTGSLAHLGAAGTVPSLVLMGVLAAVACFFSR